MTRKCTPAKRIAWYKPFLARVHKPAARESHCDLCAPGHVHFPAWLALVIVLAIVIAVIASNSQEDLAPRLAVLLFLRHLPKVVSPVKEKHDEHEHDRAWYQPLQ
jgi:hypothetical protein